MTVSSSGSLDGFETFDFDVLTSRIEIDTLFTSDGQTLTISEVRQHDSQQLRRRVEYVASNGNRVRGCSICHNVVDRGLRILIALWGTSH